MPPTLPSYGNNPVSSHASLSLHTSFQNERSPDIHRRHTKTSTNPLYDGIHYGIYARVSSTWVVQQMMPRCLYQNCWQSFTPCRCAIEVCHHHAPSTVACEVCIREATIRGFGDILLSPLDDIPTPSTSGTHTDHASPDTSHDSSITGIRGHLSEASTVIRENGQAENNLAGLYKDEWYTFLIEERHPFSMFLQTIPL
jgi:hypothetical protein